MSSLRLKERVAIVTGGAQGIGREIARRLAQEGVKVVIADLNGPAASEAAREIGGLGLETDVASSQAVDRMIGRVQSEFGRIDILVNNAGIHVQKLAKDLTDEEWDIVQNTNACGVFYCSRAVIPEMMKRENGRIINIVTRLVGVPYSSAYIASKSAIWGFTRCLALELAPYHITVNAVAPGPVLGTGMEKWFRAKAELLGLAFDDFKRLLLSTIPLGRWCEPSDVAAVVAFLASDEAKYITGELINVTGGWSGYGVVPKKE